MAVTANHLTNNTAASANSATTASIAPTDGRIIIVGVGSKIAGSDPNIPTLSGNSMTWTQMGTQLYVPGQHERVTIFRGVTTGATTGSITISFGGQTQDRINWDVTEFIGTIITGSNGSDAIVQSLFTTQNTSSTGVTVTLSSFASSGNATYGFSYALAVVTVNPGSGFTELSINGDGECTKEVEWTASADTTVDWGWASSSFPIIGFGMEIAAAPLSGMLMSDI